MAEAMSRTLKVSAANKERIYSPTPSSVCPTESTAPGEADLADCDSEGEGAHLGRYQGEVKSWSQVSERLRGLFCELAEEDDDGMEALDARAFGTILSPMAEESPIAKFFEQESEEGTDCEVQKQTCLDDSEELFEPISVEDWHAVGCRLANVLRQCSTEDSEDEDLLDDFASDEEEVEAEPEPM
mmetsp:Transcript_27489/g.64063  ORF Transcript_27489/g.64063 Transcript_27489/m.64063 type:complete len:185 (+) Transcript_27489:54-608(+)